MAKRPWYMQPPDGPRSVYDTRDADEHAAIAAALEKLPLAHAARLAHAEGADTIHLTHLVAEGPELVEALKGAHLSGYQRILKRTGRHFQP